MPMIKVLKASGYDGIQMPICGAKERLRHVSMRGGLVRFGRMTRLEGLEYENVT
jgi:hypothetical protein